MNIYVIIGVIGIISSIVLFLAETIIIIIAMLTGALEAMRTYAEGLLNNDRQRVMIWNKRNIW